jgi:UDP-glucose 4-epimerase
VKIEFVPERPGDFSGKEVTAQKALKELGWKPGVEFEQGLRTTVEWFRRKWEK